MLPRSKSRFRGGLGVAAVALAAATLPAPVLLRAQVSASQPAGGPSVTPSLAIGPLAAPGQADPLFQHPYIDVDEWRDGPYRHRYIHGGFEGTTTRFSFYFPEKARYEGRFFQYITPSPDSETLSQGQTGESDRIGFALSSGGYFIETNGGGREVMAGPAFKADPTIGAYRANAASAQYSRVVARAMYGGKRPYGYAFGGSGGGYRTLGGMENTEGVWDGAVPYVIGSPMAIPNMFTVRMYAQRVLKDKLGQVADAADAGGSGDIYAGLDQEERAALTEITRMGFPTRGWYGWKTLGMGAFPVLYPGVVAADPGYFTDFWTKPGYEGFHPPKSLIEARVQFKAKVVRVISAADADAMGIRPFPQMGQPRGTADTGWRSLLGGADAPVAIELDTVPARPVAGADLRILSGASAGKSLGMQRVQDKVVILGFGAAGAAGGVKPGDHVQIDNSNFLAAQTYHRHQVPSRDFYAWDQFRGSDGKPIYPQRPRLIGPQFVKSTSGSVNNGHFHGKMIVIENLLDIDAMPWQADWYRSRAREYYGNRLDANFRLWYTDRANHGDFTRQQYPTQTVSYLGVLQQALRDLAAWVEKGTPPAPTTRYRIVDGQVVVPATAAARRGIQPTVQLRANGGKRAEIAVGQPVSLSAVVAVPPGTGRIVAAQWDFDGSGSFAVSAELPATPPARAVVTARRSFDKPGTYFVTLRVASQRQGDRDTAYARIQNLDRVRIVVR